MVLGKGCPLYDTWYGVQYSHGIPQHIFLVVILTLMFFLLILPFAKPILRLIFMYVSDRGGNAEGRTLGLPHTTSCCSVSSRIAVNFEVISWVA